MMLMEEVMMGFIHERDGMAKDGSEKRWLV